MDTRAPLTAIVVDVGQEDRHIDSLNVVLDGGDEPKLVPTDIKNHTPPANINAPKCLLDLGKVLPFGQSGKLVPAQQWSFGFGMPFPEIVQGLEITCIGGQGDTRF